MSHFNQLPEFEKAFLKLFRKYKSLPEDLRKLETIITNPDIGPVGVGKNFITLHQSENIKIVKARLACMSLRERSMRVVYAYHSDKIEFMYIEIYYKGDKENEDNERIKKYLQQH